MKVKETSMNSSELGVRKIMTALLIIPSMIAVTFIAVAAMLDISTAYAERSEPEAVFSDQNNACKDQPENPQGHFNSNPYCEQNPPIASFRADPPACEKESGHPSFCIPETPPDDDSWGSRRR